MCLCVYERGSLVVVAQAHMQHAISVYTVCVILTTQGHDSSSECTREVLVEPLLCKDNDGHLQPVCNIHQLMIQMTEPLREKENPVP